MRKAVFLKRNFRTTHAQTVSELAIFGAIIIFILGIILRQSVNSNFTQNTTLKAMRLALKESFEAAEAGNASRNVASILFVEDRKTVDVSKFGSIDRTPYVVGATGAFTKNLFMPVDFEETENLPVQDVFINGKHFTFTTGGFRTIGVAAGQKFYKIVPNVPDSEEYDVTCDVCFDLDRNGSVDVPASRRAEFSWQWKEILPNADEIDVDSGRNVSLDVDNDFKEELILKLSSGGSGGGIFGGEGESEGPRGPSPRDPHPGPADPNEPVPQNVGWVQVLDPQAGDIDFTYSTLDKRSGKPRPGFSQAQTIYTFNTDGTYLAVEGSKSTQKLSQYDVIERQIQLSSNTGRMCDGSNPDVEVCGDCRSAANIYRTCFEPSELILYVRTRMKDLRGKIWITPNIK